jgi:tetratricopeptide (TPR) repeat protein
VTNTTSPAATPRENGRATPVIGLLVLAVTLLVYLRTLLPSVPFWDAGEFIAVSKILGIPHPPGTPFYVLLGRVATLLPLGTIAQRVNGMSALASALAVLLTYLTTLRLIRIAQRGGISARAAAEKSAAETSAPAPDLPAPGFLAALRADWLAQVGAVTAAFLLAFSNNFWDNATGAETYSEMSLAQVLILWLALRWWEAHDRRPTVGPLFLSVYLMWLSVGLHLGVGMMGLPLIVLLLLVDRKVAVLFAMPVVSVLGVTYGLEKMAGIVLVLSIVVFWVYVSERKLPGMLALAATAGAAYGAYFAFGPAAFTPLGTLVAAASVVVPVVALALKHREGRILALALFLMLAGYSTHLYLPIRAAQHPAINMGNPSSWPALKALLEREQYGHTSMFVRRGTLQTQLDKEFWRYWKRQWPLAKPLAEQNGVPVQTEPRLWHVLLPLLLGGLGGFWQARRERVSFLTMLTLFLFATVGMILFLNFSDREVRDRDYFFTTGYHTYAIWMGLGLVWLVSWIRDSFTPGMLQRGATAAAAVLLAAQPFVILRNLWFIEDGSRNYVAHDYAWNMLAPLAPHSFVFTNGDNDTYPLWYLQQVEEFRKDVRVVNLSLLNTGWYIFQLRDDLPKVPVNLPDELIRILGAGAFQDSTGRIIYTNEFMVRHLLEQDRSDAGWIQQPYFAVTVPEHYGLDPYFSLEGLVSRVNRDTLQGAVDEPRTRENMYHRFQYRGLFNADGSWDASVYKDNQASIITSNYGAAHEQLSFYYRDHHRLDAAIAEMERVRRMFPDHLGTLVRLGGFYLEKGDTTNALQLFRTLTREQPNLPDGHYYLAVTLAFQRDVPGALSELDEAIRLEPGYGRPYYVAYQLLEQAGEHERAVEYMRRLLQANPQDEQARSILQMAQPRPGGALAPPTPPLPSH